MTVRTRVWRVTTALFVVLTAGSVWEYYNTTYRWRAYTRLVDTFLTLGVRADNAALRRAATDSVPAIQILATPASTLERLRQSLHLRWAIRTGDTVVLDFATALNTCYQVHLARKDVGWLVAQARTEPC